MRAAAVPERPYLAPWFRVAARGSRLVLEHGRRAVCLEGRAVERLLPALLPLLDGSRTIREIVSALGEPVRPAVERALGELAAHGLLAEGPRLAEDVTSTVAGTAELLASLQAAARPAEIAAALEATSITLVGSGGAGIELARLLPLSGVSVERAEAIDSGAELTVCAPSPAELPLLREWNDGGLAAGARWLQLLPFDGRYAVLGPLFVPGDTCCYECFRLRSAANLAFAAELPLLDEVPAPYPSAPALDGVLAGLAAFLIVRLVTLGDHYAPGGFYTFELGTTLGLTYHVAHRVPRCTTCSGLADLAPPLPWYKEAALERG